MASAQVCPVIGTTNTVLPPSHPAFDITKPGQVCPVVGASTDHHHNLIQHPKIDGDSPLERTEDDGAVDAAACPALKSIVNEPQNRSLDEAVCPVVGPVTTILPPNHPSTNDAKEGDICPVTKATLKHHDGKVHVHPKIEDAAEGAVCPVVGHKALA